MHATMLPGGQSCLDRKLTLKVCSLMLNICAHEKHAVHEEYYCKARYYADE